MKKNIVLSAKNIQKYYDIGGTVIKAVDNVTLDIRKSDYISITGKSGSGKSTLMHIIGLLDSPTSGSLILNGKDVSNLPESELARIRNSEIGFVFQSFNLLQRTTALDNVILPLKYSKIPKNKWKSIAIEKLKLVGLGERIYNKSNELSGGQKQRVAIARALVNDPSIILADEPTGNLDTKTGLEITDIFNKLSEQGKTIILVTHDSELAEKTNKKIVMKDGKIETQDRKRYVNT